PHDILSTRPCARRACPLPSCVCLRLGPPPHTPSPHSFPTRRSSDLDHLCGAPLVVGDLVERQAEYLRGRGAVHVVAAPRPRRYSDRKSTRLNSSHGSISYAVFCLKKKMNAVDEIVHELVAPTRSTSS